MVSVIKARNAAEALPLAVDLLLREGKRENSRNGDVLVMPTPVVTVLERPWEKVILSPVRDANPFFHLVEAVWMLAGRNTVDDLTPYVKNFANYAEPDGYVHGAYGDRWRWHFGYNQLEAVVEKLQADPFTRQAVISMWDSTNSNTFGVGFGANDMQANVKDRPCNTSVMLRLREQEMVYPSEWGNAPAEPETVLDMSVTNRSHDVLWGLLGANCVHFAVLLENLSSRLDVGMGSLTFFSNNFHAYTDILERIFDVKDVSDIWGAKGWLDSTPGYGDGPDDLRTLLLYENAEQASNDDELNLLWQYLDLLHTGDESINMAEIETPFYNDVFWAAHAHAAYRQKDWSTAAFSAERIRSPDWRQACMAWLARRQERMTGGGT